MRHGNFSEEPASSVNWHVFRELTPYLWEYRVRVFWSLVFLVAALAIPSVLAPLNRLWLTIGLLLHRLVSPVVLGIIFFGVVTPTGLVMRALGKDPLRLKLEPRATTYWIDRQPRGPSPDSLRDQF